MLSLFWSTGICSKHGAALRSRVGGRHGVESCWSLSTSQSQLQLLLGSIPGLVLLSNCINELEEGAQGTLSRCAGDTKLRVQ